MIYKLTLIKNLPNIDAGFSFYIRGTSSVSEDGRSWYKTDGRLKDVVDLRYRDEWVKSEETDLVDDRPHLSEMVKEELYTVKGILDKLGWSYYQVSEHSFNEIFCCGEKVHLGGFVGVEDGHCRKCDKGFQDMTGFLRTSNSTVGMLDDDLYQADDGRVFAVLNNQI